MVRSTNIVTAAAAILWTANSVMAQDGNGFMRVATDFGDSKPTGVVLPTICIGDFLVPKTMYTFEPTGADDTNITILSSPKDLVEPGYNDEDGLIYFKFNISAAETAEDAGVIVQFPADQLKTINACCSQYVQIKPGFIGIQQLTVSTSAVVNATLDDKQESNMTIAVSSTGLANIKVSDSSETKVDVIAKNEAEVNINGDVTSISCTEKSNCKVSGSIKAPEDSEANKASTIKTGNCEGIDVGKESVCQSKVPTVRVVTSSPLVLSGIKENCVNGGGLYGAYGPNFPPTEAPTISPAPSLSMAPTIKPTKKKTKRPSPAPTEAPASDGSSSFSLTKQGTFASLVFGVAISMLLLGQ